MEVVLTVRCKLQPSASQAESLGRTVDQFAAACNRILRVARENNTFNKFALQKLCYAEIREQYGLSANLAVRALARVGKRKGKRTGGFKATSVDYDQRILSLKDEVVSLTTVDGRLKIPLAIGNYQRHLLLNAKSVQGGQLVRGKRGKWYVHLQIRTDVPTPPGRSGKVVGVDLGQVQMATLSDGQQATGGKLKSKRLEYRARRREVRSKLDTKRTTSRQRAWERLSGKERRFVRNCLHVLTRRIVDGLAAGDTLAIEDLTHLRGNTKRWGKDGRYLHNLWPYSVFRQQLEYKAARRGVVVIAVEPRNTSRTCPRCGCCDKANRKTQKLFRCIQCGFQHNADAVAATNIAQRAGSMSEGRCHAAPVPATSHLNLAGKPTALAVGS